MKRLFSLLFFIPVAAIGHYHTTGKVLNIIGNKPVAGASVFLGDASAGAKTWGYRRVAEMLPVDYEPTVK